MEIVVNAKILQYKFSGVQRYLTEILEYGKRNDISFNLLEHGYKGKQSYLYEQTILNFRNARDVLWSPSNIGPFIRKNQVITIHDTVPFDHPEWLEPDFVRMFKIFASRSYNSSNALICISEFTKSRIVSLFPHLESKISVVHNGVSKKFFIPSSDSANLKLPSKYVLALSAIEPRKNISGLIKAWSSSINQIPDDVYLVIAGEKGRSEIFKNVDIDEYDLKKKRIIFTGFIPEKDLVGLYRGALFFVYPSFYEGFGLPVLEAMATGLPVITSNTSSLKEIASTGSILVDPHSSESISEALIVLSNNQQLRLKLSHEAHRHANKFTWDACSESTWKILERMKK